MDTSNGAHQAITRATRLGVFSWCLMDWANSAFITLVAGFIFGPYLTNDVLHNKVLGTELWSWTIAVIGIVVALTAPLLGAMVDQLHRRKPWMLAFVLLSAIGSALLFFTAPDKAWVLWGLVVFIIAGVAFEYNQVVYNTVLFCIAPKEKIGRYSGWGWGMGYFGGLVALGIALLAFIKSGWIPKAEDLNIRAIMLFVGVWLIVFSLPFFFFTPDQKRSDLSFFQAVKKGGSALLENLNHVRRHRHIFVYLIAHLFYMDGLNTLLAYSAIFCTGVFHMPIAHVVIFAILINVMAGLGAWAFAWIDDWLGPRWVILLSIVMLILTIAVMLTTFDIVVFWIAGLVGGVFMGPVQASSRSYMAHIVPAHLATQLFGMYALSGRVTAFIGPLLVGGLVALFHSQRIGLGGALIMMFVGLIIMMFVPKEKKPSSAPHFG